MLDMILRTLKASSAIQKHIERLKDAQRLRRVGPDKGGHWEVIEKARRRFHDCVRMVFVIDQSVIIVV